MTFELLQAAAASNHWLALIPEMILACSALGLLALEIVLPRSLHRQIPAAAVIAQAVALLAVLLDYGSPQGWINPPNSGAEPQPSGLP